MIAVIAVVVKVGIIHFEFLRLVRNMVLHLRISMAMMKEMVSFFVTLIIVGRGMSSVGMVIALMSRDTAVIVMVIMAGLIVVTLCMIVRNVCLVELGSARMILNRGSNGRTQVSFFVGAASTRRSMRH